MNRSRLARHCWGVAMSKSLAKFLKSLAKPFLIETRENHKLQTETHLKLSGRVMNVQVLEADGSVAWESGAFDNLILDQGLNQAASTYICDLFRACAVGTGNTAPAVGDLGLNAEYARTVNYLTGAGNCGTTRATATQWVMRRTWDFPNPASNQNFAELGFANSTTPGANLFSRVLIKSGGTPVAVTVLTTQSLRVVYELTVNFNGADQAFNASFGGAWGVVTGTGRLQKTDVAAINPPIQSVTTTGANDSISILATLEPSFAGQISVTDSSAALLAVGSSQSYGGSVVTLAATLVAYTAGNFFRDKFATFSTTQANQNIQTFFLTAQNATQPATWAFLMSAAKNKTNLATLTLTFRISWSR